MVSTTPKNNFRFFIPIDEITKAKNKDGVEVMRLGGIASTKRRDTDGESLNPGGMDLSYLQERGIINWSHDKSPDSVIGEPSLAEIRKEGLYVEGTLYPESTKAKQVYQLAQTLKKSKASRKLGWSVEGKVTRRDPLDESKVLESAITNIAVCISPKNPDSIVDIIKGNYHGWADDEKPPLQENVDFEAALGGQQYIIDITRKDGVRVTVDEDYNIHIHKAEEDEEKALTTSSSSGQAVTHEHVDGETKDQMNSNIKPTTMKKAETEDQEFDGLTEEDVIQRIMSTNSVITIEKAQEIFKNLNNLTMSTKTKITDDLLEKSLDKLGFKKALSTKKYQAKTDADRDNEKEVGGEREEDLDADDETEIIQGKNPKAKKTRPDPVKKAEDDEDEEDDEEEKPKKKKFMKKGNDIKDREEEDRDEEDNEEEDDDQHTRKSVKKSKKPEMKKSLVASEFIDNSDEMAELKDMIKSLAVVTKAGYDLAKAQQDEIADLREKMEEFGEAPVAQGRKSITKSGGDRKFNKGMGAEDTLEKAEDGKPIVDVDRGKRQVLNMLDHMTFNKGVNGQMNQEFAKAMSLFEASGVMESNIQKSLETEFGVHLIRSKN